MRGSKLDLIRQYCNTAGMRLSEDDKDLLCRILENPDEYDGFESRVFEQTFEDRDPYHGRCHVTNNWQYRINIDSKLSIDKRYRHACDDGDLDEENWDWDNPIHITSLRSIKKILWEIEDEL